MASAAQQIRVVIGGAAGRLGKVLSSAVLRQPDLALAAAVDPSHLGKDIGVILGIGPVGKSCYGLLDQALAENPADVYVDVTEPDSVLSNCAEALKKGCAVIIGTSGVTPKMRDVLADEAQRSDKPVLQVPNFAPGAVLMMQFAEVAANVFSHVEIIEMHHHTKKDAPSGTARRTREVLAQKLGKSADDIPTHSVRLPGAGAHQMVIFGSEGELLTIRHDSLNWSCFAEGALKAIRGVQRLAGLNVGLEAVL